jgi:hypothetical protein
LPDRLARAGRLAAIGATSITAETTDGKLTEVAVTDKTTFTRAGRKIELKDLRVGDRIVSTRRSTTTGWKRLLCNWADQASIQALLVRAINTETIQHITKEI